MLVGHPLSTPCFFGKALSLLKQPLCLRSSDPQIILSSARLRSFWGKRLLVHRSRSQKKPWRGLSGASAAFSSTVWSSTTTFFTLVFGTSPKHAKRFLGEASAKLQTA